MNPTSEPPSEARRPRDFRILKPILAPYLLATYPLTEYGTVSPGVGKTHLAVGLGLKAIEHGYRVLFTTAAAMLTTLTKTLNEGCFDDELKVFTIPRLLTIEEIASAIVDRSCITRRRPASGAIRIG